MGISVLLRSLTHELLDMALLDRLGSDVARRGRSDCLHDLGDKYVFGFIA